MDDMDMDFDSSNSGGLLGSITSGIMSQGNSDTSSSTAPSDSDTTSGDASTGDASGAASTGDASGAASTGDINRANPYQPTKIQLTGTQKMGNAMKAFQQGQQAALNSPSAPTSAPSTIIPGSVYNALFASQTTPGMLGGGQIGVQTPTQIQQAQPTQTAQMQMAPQTQSTIQLPQAQPMQMPTVSDIRAKFHIQKAEKEMDDFLTRVYSNILNKRGNR
jgi:hypothetical protein